MDDGDDSDGREAGLNVGGISDFTGRRKLDSLGLTHSGT